MLLFLPFKWGFLKALDVCFTLYEDLYIVTTVGTFLKELENFIKIFAFAIHTF